MAASMEEVFAGKQSRNCAPRWINWSVRRTRI